MPALHFAGYGSASAGIAAASAQSALKLAMQSTQLARFANVATPPAHAGTAAFKHVAAKPIWVGVKSSPVASVLSTPAHALVIAGPSSARAVTIALVALPSGQAPVPALFAFFQQLARILDSA